MKSLAKLIYAAPESLRTRLGKNLVGASEEGNKVVASLLGVPGSARSPSRPGEPPRRRTGGLIHQTRFVAAAAKLEITLLTSDVGKWLNDGTRKMLPRPWKLELLRRAAPAIKAALHRR
jgi:hypothetical protein